MLQHLARWKKMDGLMSSKEWKPDILCKNKKCYFNMDMLLCIVWFLVGSWKRNNTQTHHCTAATYPFINNIQWIDQGNDFLPYWHTKQKSVHLYVSHFVVFSTFICKLQNSCTNGGAYKNPTHVYFSKLPHRKRLPCFHTKV